MTPEELRRLARHNEASANILAMDADRLRVQSAGLNGSLDPLIPMSQRVWTGPAAQDFEDTVRAHSRVLADQSRRLRQIADELDRQAQMERREAVELRAKAAAVQAAALSSSVVPGLA